MPSSIENLTFSSSSSSPSSFPRPPLKASGRKSQCRGKYTSNFSAFHLHFHTHPWRSNSTGNNTRSEQSDRREGWKFLPWSSTTLPSCPGWKSFRGWVLGGELKRCEWVALRQKQVGIDGVFGSFHHHLRDFPVHCTNCMFYPPNAKEKINIWLTRIAKAFGNFGILYAL